MIIKPIKIISCAITCFTILFCFTLSSCGNNNENTFNTSEESVVETTELTELTIPETFNSNEKPDNVVPDEFNETGAIDNQSNVVITGYELD